MLLSAALGAVLLAGLALIASGAGHGSATITLFLRLNDVLVRPLGLLPPLADPLGRQIAAIVVYGTLLAAITGAVAWLDRRQGLGY